MLTAPIPNFAHAASYIATHDGDSFWLRVDRGQLTQGIKDDPTWYIRLFGIDTWEVGGPKHPLDLDRARGRAAKDFTALTLTATHRIIVQTIHPDLRPAELEKYGRILARVWVDGVLLEDLLRADGHEKVRL